MMTPISPLPRMLTGLPGLFPSFRDDILNQILDPCSATSYARIQAPLWAPYAPFVVSALGGMVSFFRPFPPLVFGMVRGKKPQHPRLSEAEFEEAWLNGLSLAPDIAGLDDIREIESRIERKAARGQSTARLWKTLSEIAAATEDQAVRAAALKICDRRQGIYEAGLKSIGEAHSAGDQRPLWRGLQHSIEYREYDHMADFVVALLRRNDSRINHRLIQYPHPAVRSFVYSFLISFGHHERIREYWREFESTLFREDIETSDPEIRRFTVGVLIPVLAAGTQQELAHALHLHAAWTSGDAEAIRRAIRLLSQSPSGGENTPLSYLVTCLTSPDDPELRFLARRVLDQLADRLEVKEKK